MHIHRHHFCGCLFCVFGVGNVGFSAGFAKRNGNLSGKSKHAVAVLAVACHTHIEHVVVYTHFAANIATDNCRITQYQHTLDICAFVVILSNAKLFRSAKHTPRLLTAHFALGDVQSVCRVRIVKSNRHFVADLYVMVVGDNGDNFAADVHLATKQAFGIGVLGNFLNLANLDVCHVFAEVDDFLDFQTDVHHLFA